jgi:hypothetical protein
MLHQTDQRHLVAKPDYSEAKIVLAMVGARIIAFSILDLTFSGWFACAGQVLP